MNSAEELRQYLPDSILSLGMQKTKPLAIIKKDHLLRVAKKVEEMGFDNLSLITGIDYNDRFEVIYNFFSYAKKQNLVLKVVLEHESPEVASLCSIWKVADWLERETYDLVVLNSQGIQISKGYYCLTAGRPSPQKGL